MRAQHQGTTARCLTARLRTSHSAFTLIELVVVILIIAIVSTLVAINLGTFTYWKEQGFIRKLSQTIIFLHTQAVIDQAHYRLEFNLKENSYRVGVLRPEGEVDDNLAQIASDAGLLTLELAAFLNPSPGSINTMIPPPSFPSLAEPVRLPEGDYLEDVRTVRGKTTDPKDEDPYVIFSPRGFSEFAVIHLRLQNNAPVTLLINPFTGLVDIFHEYKDFQWTYGRQSAGRRS